MTSTTILAAPPSSTTTRANTVSDSDQHSILLNHQHGEKPQTKAFCPRICTTNRIPTHEHGHCPLEHEIHGMCPTGEASPARSSTEEEPPSDSARLLHRVKHDRSILSLAVSEKFVFAGSQSGEILVRCVLRGLSRRTAPSSDSMMLTRVDLVDRYIPASCDSKGPLRKCAMSLSRYRYRRLATILLRRRRHHPSLERRYF
jgi:hypothetical protein